LNKLKKLYEELAIIDEKLINDFKLDSKTVERQIYYMRKKRDVLDEIKQLEIQAGFAFPDDEPAEEFEPDTVRQTILWYVIFGGKLPLFCTMTNTFTELLFRAYTPKNKHGGL
jgi:hypothetical protein